MIEILYEAGPCLVVNKPSGLLTQAPSYIDSLERQIKDFLKEREHKPGNVYLGVPHRLDRPVSGTIVVCKHARAARRMSEQFESRTIRKIYHALVEGNVEEDSGTWTDYMRKIPDEAAAEFVAEDHPDAREAILHYRVLNRLLISNSVISSPASQSSTISSTTISPSISPSTISHLSPEVMISDGSEPPAGFCLVTWLEIELETGRMHQIRLQCGGRVHAILGDAQYGSSIPFGESFEDVRMRGIALHAHQLSFRHPMTHEPVEVIAPKPSTWQTFLP